MRQPVSPMTAIRLIAAGKTGTARPPTVSFAVVNGTVALHTVIGKSPSAAPRWVASMVVLSAMTSGQAATPEPTTTRTVSLLSAPSSTQGPATT